MRVALVVDNPLRDLDGLVLLARELALRGVEPYLVPMYHQGGDVPAIGCSVVVANYVRENNRDLLAMFRQAGVAVVVLDTEGVAGKTPEDFGRIVGRNRPAEVADLYCTWGPAQRDSLVAAGVFPDDRVVVTGCPRYDFCAPAWRSALEAPSLPPGYLLVNTNFPTVNPRFSVSPEAEIGNMVKAGFDDAFARRFVADARRAHQQVKATVGRLATALPDLAIVLRPHPFERIEAYAELTRHPNVSLRQEGTSLSWIAHASALLHQNCSTAVEAAMLGVEALSMEWFNSDALRVPGPCAVSTSLSGDDDLLAAVRSLRSGTALPVDASVLAARADVLGHLYLAIDGHAAARVADVVQRAARERPVPIGAGTGFRRARVVAGVRRMLGHRGLEALRRLRPDPQREARVQGKRFGVPEVQAVLDRMGVAGTGSAVASAPSTASLVSPRLYSGGVVQVGIRA